MTLPGTKYRIQNTSYEYVISRPILYSVFAPGLECNAAPRPASRPPPLATCRKTDEARSHATTEILFSSPCWALFLASQGLDSSLQPWKAFQTSGANHLLHCVPMSVTEGPGLATTPLLGMSLAVRADPRAIGGGPLTLSPGLPSLDVR